MTLFVFPAHLLNPDPVSADVVPTVVDGGTAISGEQDLIESDGGGRWMIDYGSIVLDTPEKLRVWSAWVSHLAGGAQSVLVPLLGLELAPRPFAGDDFAVPSDVVVDDPDFPTSVAFASAYVVAETVGAAALRATEVTILVTQGAPIRAGMRFSVGARAYKVERVTARDGLEATCKVMPPLREAIADGTAVNFDWAVVEARATPGQDLRAPVEQGEYAEVSVSFVEHVTYA